MIKIVDGKKVYTNYDKWKKEVDKAKGIFSILPIPFTTAKVMRVSELKK